MKKIMKSLVVGGILLGTSSSWAAALTCNKVTGAHNTNTTIHHVIYSDCYYDSNDKKFPLLHMNTGGGEENIRFLVQRDGDLNPNVVPTTQLSDSKSYLQVIVKEEECSDSYPSDSSTTLMVPFKSDTKYCGYVKFTDKFVAIGGTTKTNLSDGWASTSFTVYSTTPTITNASTSMKTNSTNPINPFSSIDIEHNDGDNMSATIMLDDQSKGTLSVASIDATTGEALTTALQNLTFTPNLETLPLGESRVAKITLTVTDENAGETTQTLYVRYGKSETITAGYDATFFIKDDGTVQGIGSQRAGFLGDGVNGGWDDIAFTPKDLNLTTSTGRSFDANITKVFAGQNYSYALDSNGRLFTWGDDSSSGYCGFGNSDYCEQTVPTAIDVNLTTATGQSFDANIVDMAGKNANGYALDINGSVYAWGGQNGGALGNGATSFAVVSTPLKIDSFPQGSYITDVTTSYTAVYALDINGSIYAWGSDYSGSSDASIPTSIDSKFPSEANIVSISSGNKTLYALDKNGTVWAMGEGSNGECGDGTNNDCNNQAKQVSLPEDANITKIASYYSNRIALALDANGKVYGWGQQNYGELMNKEKEGIYSTPFELNTTIATGWHYDANITDISVGRYQVILKDDQGNYLTAGINSSGKLGNGQVLSNQYGTTTPQIVGVTPYDINGTSTQQQITWNKPSIHTPDSYKLYRSTTSDGDYTLIAENISGESTTYVDTTAQFNTEYYYTVAAQYSKFGTLTEVKSNRTDMKNEGAVHYGKAIWDKLAVDSTAITEIGKNEEYSYTPAATSPTGNALTWSVKDGTTLPDWLTLETKSILEKIVEDQDYVLGDIVLDNDKNIIFSEMQTSNVGNNRIRKYDITTKEVTTLVENLGAARGLVIDNGGILLYTDSTNDTISYYSPQNSGTIVDSGLASPRGIVTDEDNNIYFVDTDNSAIKKLYFVGESKQVDTVVDTSHGISYPYDVAYHDGYLYIIHPDNQNMLIKKYNISENTIETLLDQSKDAINSPQRLTLDSSGNIYIAQTNSIVKYDATTETITMLAENISYPNGITLDGEDIYFTHASQSSIEKITSSTVLSGTTPDVLGVYDVNLSVSDQVEEIEHSFSIKIVDLEIISADVSQGSINTATKITYILQSGNTLKYMFSNSSVNTPAFKDDLPNSAVSYTSGMELTDAKVGQYLVVYEVNSDGKIVGFYQQELTNDDIYTVVIVPKLVKPIEDQLIDVNDTQSFDFNLTSYFENTDLYGYSEVNSDNNISDWLDLNSTTGILSVKDGVDSKSLLDPGKYFIKIDASNRTDTNATGYFTLRVKDLNTSLSQYIDSNITGQTTGTGTDEQNRSYAETNATVNSVDIQVKVFNDGSAYHEIKNVASATSELPDSKVKLESSGDVNTTTSTINDSGQIVDIEVLGKVNDSGGVKAEHTLKLEDGNITKAISKVSNTTTTIRRDRSVETNATVGSSNISVEAKPDGKAKHSVVKDGKTSKANVNVPGAQTTIDSNGEVDTKLSIILSDTNNCGGSYYAEVVTTRDGENITKFRNDNENCYTAPTLIYGEEFPSGSDSNITQDSSNIIHIQTTTPVLNSATNFTID